jgi:serine/threonine-protein kinase
MIKRRRAGPTVGGRFAGYLLHEQVGSGSMAAVYRATRGPGTREVALKVAHAALADRVDVCARFEREAKVIGRLCHPLCVRLFDWGMHDELPYVAVEFVQGHDLARLLELRGRFSPVFALRATIELCDLLHTAHLSGIVHRDLKPTNIMLVGESADIALGAARPAIKVLDFGVAKIGVVGSGDWQTCGGDPLTSAGAIVGTPTHMAPELVTGGMVDGRTDLYSCGVLLYQMVTGELPFKGKDALRVALSHVADQPTAPRRLLPELSRHLESVIMQCLRKLPEERPCSAYELSRQLLSIAPAIETQAHA